MNKPNTPKNVPDFMPGRITESAKRRYFEMGGGISIEKNRWFLVSCALTAALIAESVAFSCLFPLRTVETVAVTKLEGGRLAVDPTPLGRWEPDNDSLTYFLSKWANSVFDVNRSTIEMMIKESSSMTVGDAAKKLRQMRLEDNPLINLHKIPNYTRSYEFKSINFVSKDTALLRFKTVTRRNDDVTEKTYLMSITFIRVKPDSISAVVKNPAGLFISRFTLSEESARTEPVPESSPNTASGTAVKRLPVSDKPQKDYP